MTSSDRTRHWIGVLLRSGVLLSAAIVLFGATVYLRQHGREPVPDYRHFQGPSGPCCRLRETVSQAVKLNGLSIVQIGLLLLIATPIMRVLFSAVTFAVERDRLYVGITLFVLAILLAGLSGFGPR